MTWPTDAHDLLKEDRESYTNSTSRWKRGVNDRSESLWFGKALSQLAGQKGELASK